MDVTNPIIVALDVGSAEDAVRMATQLAPHVGGFKVGIGLMYGPGPMTIDALVRLGKPVFADAKLHDIPSQVERAAYRIGTHGARWVTAHASGGHEMLEAAAAGLGRGSGSAEAGILAVTVLTSLDESDLQRIGIQRTPGQMVGKLAKVAAASQCEGVVCSPRELNVVRQAAPDLVAALDEADLEAGLGQISRRNEPVGAGSDHHRVPLTLRRKFREEALRVGPADQFLHHVGSPCSLYVR
jgi:orotidine-5'-phosphate decarboxylase